MSATVVIVGTNHDYQWGGAQVEPSALDAFRALLTDLASKHCAVAIAEEMNVDALRLHEQSSSVPAMLCSSLGIGHAYCDPSEREQTDLGIINDGVIRLWQTTNGWGEAEVQHQISIEYLKRERYWVSRLLELDRWPTIFICGSLHTERFAQLLREERVQVVVAHTSWAA